MAIATATAVTLMAAAGPTVKNLHQQTVKPVQMVKTSSAKPRFYGAPVGAVYVAAGTQNVVRAGLGLLAGPAPCKRQAKKEVAELIARPKVAVALG